jgi:hypothetical protein
MYELLDNNDIYHYGIINNNKFYTVDHYELELNKDIIYLEFNKDNIYKILKNYNEFNQLFLEESESDNTFELSDSDGLQILINNWYLTFKVLKDYYINDNEDNED